MNAASDGRWLRWGFVLPTIGLLLALNVFPLLYDLYLSFTDAHLSGGVVEYVGGGNYAKVFAKETYGESLRTTALFVVVAVGLQLALGFSLALALHRPFPGKTVVLTLLLVPMMLPPAVMGLFWNLILNGQYGVANDVLGACFGWEPQWLTDPDYKLASVILVDVWMWTPFMLLISLAALNAIPKHLYEAAEVDRASSWTVFRRITLPMCLPLLGLAVLLRTTDALKQFDLVMAFTGPNDAATATLSASLYQVMMVNFHVGRGSAFAFVVLVIVIGLASVFTRYIGYIQRRQGRAVG